MNATFPQASIRHEQCYSAVIEFAIGLGADAPEFLKTWREGRYEELLVAWPACPGACIPAGAPGAPLGRDEWQGYYRKSEIHVDEIDAAREGESFLIGQSAGLQSPKIERPEQQLSGRIPRVSTVALFDEHDRLRGAYLLTRDAMNRTQLTMVGELPGYEQPVPDMVDGLPVVAVLEMAMHYVRAGDKSTVLSDQLKRIIPAFQKRAQGVEERGQPLSISRDGQRRPVDDELWDETLRQRDDAQDRLDSICSLILNEPVNWSFHDAKWTQAHEIVAACAEEAKSQRGQDAEGQVFINLLTGKIARGPEHPGESGKPTDTDLLDLLDRKGNVSFHFETARVEIEVPESFVGANGIRELLAAAHTVEN